MNSSLTYRLRILIHPVLAVLLVCGVSFIRNPAFFGFNGYVLTLVGVSFVFISVLSRGLRQGFVPSSTPLKFFLLWLAFSLLIVLARPLFVRGLPGAVTDESLFLAIELAINGALYIAGYFWAVSVRKASSLILLALTVWYFVFVLYSFDLFASVHSLRRLNHIMSVNYLGAIIASLSSGLVIYAFVYRGFLAVAIFPVLMLSTSFLLLTGSRSALLGFVLALLIGAKMFLRLNFTMLSSALAGIFILLISFGVAGDVILDYFDLEFTGRERFMLENVQTTRIDIYREVLDMISGVGFLVGEAGAYALFGLSDLHPHNLFLGILWSVGFISLSFFVVFLVLVFRDSFYFVRRASFFEKRELGLVFALVTPVFFYAMFSGHFTRHHFLFLLIGVLCGTLRAGYRGGSRQAEFS